MPGGDRQLTHTDAIYGRAWSHLRDGGQPRFKSILKQ